MTKTTNREIITTVRTVADLPTTTAEISILARELRAASFGAITHREAIERARGLVASRSAHASDCAIRAIGLALNADTDTDASRFVESAIRFISVAMKAA